MPRVSICVALLLLICAPNLQAAGWGNLSGRFLFDGTPPKPVKCNVTKDVAVCTKHHPMVEDVVVSDKGELANVFVWVRTSGVAVHPDFAKTAKDTIKFDNKFCRFAPHAVAVRTGQTLRLANADAAGHNALARCRKNTPFNVTLPAGGQKDVVFTKAERLPFRIECAIHPWMAGWVLVQDHPYMAISAADGTFKISNLPAGVPLEFQVWQEMAGYVSDVKQDGKPASWTRGRFTKTLAKGDNDLGDLKVSEKLFQ